jgi:GNAT superfamily N-acetyltransferase
VGLHIERATEQDAEIIATVLGEVEEYYGGSPEPPKAQQVRNALFGPQPAATVLLARDNGEPAGLASYSFLWPAAGADTSLFLKELYVRTPYRRRGIARELIAAVRSEAQAAGCTRLEWQADADNPAALAFYEALGAVPNEGKIFYRVLP